jgi:predicted TIM-barrel fold metal-dependent hydrolase
MTDPTFPPRGACDCHVHVVGPKAQYPLTKHRTYTPMDAPLPALRAHLAGLALDRVVVVQPSFYGTDNSCTLAALAALGPAARGVAVVDADISPGEIDRLHGAGIRGIRINLASFGTASGDKAAALVRDAARVCERHGWHVQLFTPAAVLVALAALLPELGVPVVIDHFGLINPHERQSPALDTLLRLLAADHVWVKLSAPYRIADDVGSPDVAALARRLTDANPDRAVWGSDWPHTPVHKGAATTDEREMPYRDINSAELLALVPAWLPDAARLDAVMTANPAKLYDF